MRRWLGNEPVNPGDPDGDLTPPTLYFFSNALFEKDPRLTVDPLTGKPIHAPTCTVEEFSFYRWPENHDGQPVRETPVKEYDHGMDALRYLLLSLEKPGAARRRARIIR